MPSGTTKVDHTTPAIVSSAASPVILTIQPSQTPVTITIAAASAITVTGAAIAGRPVDIAHTP